MSLPSFDSLRTLLDRDPIAFDALRKDLIEEEISHSCPENQRRLRGLQFQIEGIIKTSKNPLDCCIKIQSMLSKKLDELSSILHDNHSLASRSPNPNNIIRFPRRDEG
ncbi:MAG: DUF3135 domain-containing protein [Marinobacter sp.]